MFKVKSNAKSRIDPWGIEKIEIPVSHVIPPKIDKPIQKSTNRINQW
jgi:hypothetical protein